MNINFSKCKTCGSNLGGVITSWNTRLLLDVHQDLTRLKQGPWLDAYPSNRSAVHIRIGAYR